jgi:dTDP-4-amino-4,6-dideoxygalactose transaminase
MATAEVIALLGAVPVFVDIDPVTFNIDPVQLERTLCALKSGDSNNAPLPRLKAPKPKELRPVALIAVDLFGIPADYARIEKICQQHGLFLIEDAAQSFGAVYRGRKAGSFGDVGCTSFFPSKPLGGYGDGGMCFTNDDRLAEAMRSLRVHGQSGASFQHDRIGINGRLDTLQAAILLVKLELFEEEISRRQEIALGYNRLLRSITGLSTPEVPDGIRSAWAQYTVMAANNEQRDRLIAQLKEAGVPTAVYYPLPLHLQKSLADLGYRRGDFPVCENCCQRVLSLPIQPYLSMEYQNIISRSCRLVGLVDPE